MKCVVLNTKGNFDPWDPAKMVELKRGVSEDRLGQKLLFENVRIKVWEVILYPGERLPFRKITRNYYFSSLTDGLGLSRSADGSITMVHIGKDDSLLMRHEGQEAVYDFENIGETIIFLHAMEFMPLVEETNSLDALSRR